VRIAAERFRQADISSNSLADDADGAALARSNASAAAQLLATVSRGLSEDRIWKIICSFRADRSERALVAAPMCDRRSGATPLVGAISVPWCGRVSSCPSRIADEADATRADVEVDTPDDVE